MAKRSDGRRMHLELAISSGDPTAVYDVKDFDVISFVSEGGTYTTQVEARVQGASTFVALGSARANGTYETNLDISGFDEIRFAIGTYSVAGTVFASAF